MPVTIDPQTEKEIRSRLAAINDEATGAIEMGNEPEVARLTEEAQGLSDYLRKGLDIRGGPRPLGLGSETDRKAARRRYGTALSTLRGKLPALYEHLNTAIKSGQSFVYRPKQDTNWQT